jgi:replication-associated recombination protein RarA
MDDLFTNNIEENAPLPTVCAPRTLDEFIGQEHIVGEGEAASPWRF